MTTGKTIALTRWTFVGKVISLLFNILSRLVTAFLPRSKCLLISWLQSPSAVILEFKKVKSLIVSIVSPYNFILLQSTPHKHWRESPGDISHTHKPVQTPVMPLVAPLATTQLFLVTTMLFPPMRIPSSAQLLVLVSSATISGDLAPRGCQSNIFLYYSISQNSQFTISLLPRVRRSLPECKWTFFYLHQECLAIKKKKKKKSAEVKSVLTDLVDFHSVSSSSSHHGPIQSLAPVPRLPFASLCSVV